MRNPFRYFNSSPEVVRLAVMTHYLWRAVDHQGEVLEVFATKRRNRRAALKFLKRVMKRHGRPRTIATDRLRSDAAAMRAIGIGERQECGRWLNNRAVMGLAGRLCRPRRC